MSTGFYGFQYIGSTQIIIIMCMKIEMDCGITLYYFRNVIQILQKESVHPVYRAT